MSVAPRRFQPGNNLNPRARSAGLGSLSSLYRRSQSKLASSLHPLPSGPGPALRSDSRPTTTVKHRRATGLGLLSPFRRRSPSELNRLVPSSARAPCPAPWRLQTGNNRTLKQCAHSSQARWCGRQSISANSKGKSKALALKDAPNSWGKSKPRKVKGVVLINRPPHTGFAIISRYSFGQGSGRFASRS